MDAADPQTWGSRGDVYAEMCVLSGIGFWFFFQLGAACQLQSLAWGAWSRSVAS